MEPKAKRIMIVGPTASGKSDLAVRLALETGGEIISVDSRQCYKRIDIGTAKPDERQLDAVRHYNISVLNLGESDSASRFLTRAEEYERQIRDKGKRIIYAGGSTLHLQGLIQPFDNLPGANPVNQKELHLKAEKEGLDVLFKLLKKADPDYASAMDGLNRQRIIRALDVWMQTGRPFSSFHHQGEATLPDDLYVFGLRWQRKLLYEKINRRVDRMIESGLVDETRNILDDGYSPDLQSLQTVGYRDVIQYLHGEIAPDRMIADIKTKTRRYAKRQLTWFRRWPFITWLPASGQTEDSLTETILKHLSVVSDG